MGKIMSQKMPLWMGQWGGQLKLQADVMTKTAQVSDENTHIFQADKQSLFKANIILCSTNFYKTKEKSMHLHDFSFLSVNFRDGKGKACCRYRSVVN